MGTSRLRQRGWALGAVVAAVVATVVAAALGGVGVPSDPVGAPGATAGPVRSDPDTRDIPLRVVTVGVAELDVPATWRIIPLPEGSREPCPVGADDYDEPTLYVAARYPDRDVRGALPDCPRVGGSAGGMLYPLIGSRFDALEGGEAITIAGWSGTVFRFDGVFHAADDRVETRDVRRYSFPALDLGFVVRADPDPAAVEALLGSLRLVDGARALDDPSGDHPVPDVALPTRLVADAYEVVDLDPVTGKVRWRAGPRGDGPGGVALDADGTAWSTNVDHVCALATIYAVTPEGAAGLELAGAGAVVSPDGTRLAYERGCPDDVASPPSLVVRELDRSTQVVVRNGRPAAWPPRFDRVRIGELLWHPDGDVLLVQLEGSDVDDASITGWFTIDPSRDRSLAEGEPLPRAPWDTGDGPTALRAARGTLLVARSSDPGQRRNPLPDETTDIVEVDLATGEVVATLLTVDGRVSWLDVDATGEHVLFIRSMTGNDQRRTERDALYRWHPSTGPVYLGEGYLSADW